MYTVHSVKTPRGGGGGPYNAELCSSVVLCTQVGRVGARRPFVPPRSVAPTSPRYAVADATSGHAPSVLPPDLAAVPQFHIIDACTDLSALVGGRCDITRSSAAALQTKCARSAPSTRRCLQQRCVMYAGRASGRSPTLRPTAVGGAHLAPVPLGGCDQRTRAVRGPARPCRRSPIPLHRRMHRSIGLGWWPMRHNAGFCSGRSNQVRA